MFFYNLGRQLIKQSAMTNVLKDNPFADVSKSYGFSNPGSNIGNKTHQALGGLVNQFPDDKKQGAIKGINETFKPFSGLMSAKNNWNSNIGKVRNNLQNANFDTMKQSLGRQQEQGNLLVQQNTAKSLQQLNNIS